ncbi:hypothetical protein AB0P15_35740 [Streptomyces sp. NPDC087917]|uniref:hypothetical protein n=1 Tax=unclassified Streptomyces TaxID=2593676 RepID=UPI00342D3543
MAELMRFGAGVAWLSERRGLGVGVLAEHAGVGADEVRAVLAGETPGEGLLRGIAPVLGFRAVDLFLFAGVGVPEDLAPVDREAGRTVRQIVMDGLHLAAEERRELLQFTRSLPLEERTCAFVPKWVERVGEGPGAWIIGMLQYRNLDWHDMAHLLAVLTPSYLSAATYGMVGAGRSELTPRLVRDCAALLGIDAVELGALVGVEPAEAPPSVAPEAVDAAELLWEARRLSVGQAERVAEVAKSMRTSPSDHYRLNLSGG